MGKKQRLAHAFMSSISQCPWNFALCYFLEIPYLMGLLLLSFNDSLEAKSSLR